MPPIDDHPMRYALTNELHARPFPVIRCPAQAAFLAIKPSGEATEQDRGATRAHLLDLLDRHGAPHPQPDATHYFGQLGRFQLKWEQHTEFVTYTAFVDGNGGRAFDPALWEVFPADWLAAAPGLRMTSAHIRVAPLPEEEPLLSDQLADWFVPESLAVSRVLDGAALIAGDFRIAGSGHTHFAVFAKPGTGDRRIGRIVQRICEIETYKSMSMLALPRARALTQRLGPLEDSLSQMTAAMADEGPGAAEASETLGELLKTAGALENLMAQAAYRFAATRAYEALVHQRISILREERYRGRQTFSEFMMRRFDPAMRTVKATERRVQSMTARAIRAGDLLRTRVDVDRSAQNQALLESMDRRAALQLSLQKTVEGLSVVAISYYAVNLVVYLLAPLSEPVGLSKTSLTALIVLPVMLIVWLMVHAIRKSMD